LLAAIGNSQREASASHTFTTLITYEQRIIRLERQSPLFDIAPQSDPKKEKESPICLKS
jgi:hypothetical protein